MSDQSHITRILGELKQAIAADRLPSKLQDRAEQLRDRIEQPLRIGLLGRPAAGKSTLRDLLVGTNVVLADVKMPTLDLTYADPARAICTLADGSKVTFHDIDPYKIAELAPVFVEMQMPLPALAKISVLDIEAPDDPVALQRASFWAVKRSDVLLWCSKAFDDAELAIWSQMSDEIKDHAFLMITHADRLRDDDRLDALLAHAAMTAADEFHKILAIATTDAIAARQSDGSVDKKLMHESGGMALIAAILKQVESGKQSAVDAAQMLLAQHQETIASPPTPAPTALVKSQTATQAAYRTALDQITAKSQNLIARADDATPAQITAEIVAQLQWLCDYLEENGDDANPSLLRARDTAFDAADLVQLMQMERRDSAAIEAVSLLLQVKRELQAELAA